MVTESVNQPFDSESTGSSEDSDLIPIHSGDDWVVLLDDDLSQPDTISGASFRITTLQKEDPVCITLVSWITSGDFRYILVIADYFSKWTEAFQIKNKCADTVADVLVEKIILRFGMPLVIHSDQGCEFENGLMKSLCTLLGCTKTRTAPYRPESDGMIEQFNRTCLMMLSMFINDRRDNWNELLPYVMHAYRTSVHESTGYSPFRLMMGEEYSLPQDAST